MPKPGKKINVGWACEDITPDKPVFLAGQFHARVSEGVLDPVTVTALALDSGGDHVVMASCDLVSVSDELRDAVRGLARKAVPDLDPLKIVLNATHTHTAPHQRPSGAWAGVELPVMPAGDYVEFAASRIAGAIQKAWATRAPGKIAYGQGFAVVGRNRRWVNTAGTSTMYGNTDVPDFCNIEGYEDHSVNILATKDASGRITGLVINLACPSQETEQLYSISADYWHETRREIKKRLGDSVHVLAQCSAAGDQSPHLIYEKQADERMLRLKGRTRRQEIAHRIAGAVEDVLPCLDGAFEDSMPVTHVVKTVNLDMNVLTEEDVRTAAAEADKFCKQYEMEKQKLASDEALRTERRWYVPITYAYNRMQWWRRVVERFEKRESTPTLAVEIHVVRLGDVVFATNPFEYYLDFGTYIKARSKAGQTFLVQLAGRGTYVPSRRSITGGGYGSVPASNVIGPEGGRYLAEKTVEIINGMWKQMSASG
ncbi:MAG TPA: hypothetical protein ENN09_07685 [Planctomycetes bacterium]|nr:hypothetical protein [Planctomycetota bacterium]